MVRLDVGALRSELANSINHSVIETKMIYRYERNFFSAVIDDQCARFGGVMDAGRGFAAACTVSGERCSDRWSDIGLRDSCYQLRLPVCLRVGDRENKQNDQIGRCSDRDSLL